MKTIIPCLLTACSLCSLIPSAGAARNIVKISIPVFVVLLLCTWQTMAQPQFFTYTTNADGNLTVDGYTGSPGRVSMPTNVNGLTVSGIASEAFTLQTNLTDVEIPGSFTNIESAAFAECPGLTNVTIDYGIAAIPETAFVICENLANIVIPDSVKDIGESAFSNCKSLTFVTLPGHLLNFEDAAFVGSGITKISIPGTVTNMAAGVFEFCTNLTNVTIGSGASYIPLSEFYGCSGLCAIAIPETVTNIGNQAFDGCLSLTNVVIGSGVSNIASAAFQNCPKLKTVLMLGGAPATSSGPDGPAFDEDTNLTVYYLPGTTGWSTNFGGAPTALWNPVLQTHDGHFGVRNGQFGFNITGGTNIPVSVQVCTNLADPVWTPVTNVALTNGTYFYSEPVQTNTPRFFGLGFP